MKHREDLTETEALRLELEQTRQHLSETVQALTHQLNVPKRLKESATEAGLRMKDSAGMAGLRVKDTATQVPAMTKQHPKATAAVGGAVLLGAGAAAWLATRHK
ncbi:DUF3618 domain-containing protein [Kribbella antibiotica]|uniref:DUF3618 domain-containing protein n=1 Tax=Kribbella antibiotica TaxID=190195 RepID=A0A4V6PDV0_9ACTN|nr:DUF3618 domain-containing protein [Kribbella antibiotica]TDD47007.1 DUF3618 domain-containing protein [Kribbella antibiotica]